MKPDEKKPEQLKKNQKLEDELGTGKYDKPNRNSENDKKENQKPEGKTKQNTKRDNNGDAPYLDVESFIMG